MAKPKVLVCGILDTKGKEIKYLKERVQAAGADAKILEISVGKTTGWADISVGEVLAEIGMKSEDVFKLGRGAASEIITQAGQKYVKRLYDAGEMDGIIGYGGSMGASITTSIMQVLPIGIPKVMLTTMTSGDVRPYVGTKDICMMYPIAEAGINAVTKEILSRAAGAVVGMCNAPKAEDDSKPLIGCMMFGVTTPCVLRAAKFFEDTGKYDVIINHAVGSGGRSMEELIKDGFIKGMLDITTSELVNEAFGGVLPAGPDRLTAAALNGVSQVVAPGGMDIINFGAKDTIPQHHLDTIGQPGKGVYYHNPTVTCIGTSPSEIRIIAKDVGKKLSQATAPVSYFVPLKGWSACDVKEPNADLGWRGSESGPVWVEDPDNPCWSLRSRYFYETLKEHLDTSKDNIELILLDLHLNEPEFADLMANILNDMLNGEFKKGRYAHLPYIVEMR